MSPEENMAALRQSEIHFEEPAIVRYQVRIGVPSVAQFWPTTGRWKSNLGVANGKGVESLAEWLKENHPHLIGDKNE